MIAPSTQDFIVLNMSMPRDVMRFYLVYRGPLSSMQSKRKKADRIAIRSQIAPQMKKLWEVNQNLVRLQWNARVPNNIGTFAVGDTPLFEFKKVPPGPHDQMQKDFVDLCAPIPVKGKHFRPLVRKSLDLTCTLNFLFLRQEEPGALIKKAGDIDNRIKVFIDALEMPSEDLDGDEGDDINLPLLERDSLVRGIEINTERLLLPEEDFPNQVHMVVEVVVHVEHVGPWNMCLL